MTDDQRDMIFDTSVSDAALVRAFKGVKVTAWDVIGSERLVKIKGGRSVYENAYYSDERGADNVRLDRIKVEPQGLRVINRYVDPDTEIIFVKP